MQPYDNGWLLSCLQHAARTRDGAPLALAFALQSYVQSASHDILRSIAQYPGSKLFVSYSDGDWSREDGPSRDRLRILLKRLLCWTDLVVFVPAPMAPSCQMDEFKWPEFSAAAHFSYKGDVAYEVSLELQHNLLGLLLQEPQLAQSGAVTVLPGIRHRGRWTHPLIPMPRLPAPYEIHDTVAAAVTEGLMDLATDRVAAEALNAIFFNQISFRLPYLNDLACDRSATGDIRKAILTVTIPGITGVGLNDLVRLRAELSEHRARFSRLLMSYVRSAPFADDPAWSERVSAEIAKDAASLRDSYMLAAQAASLIKFRLGVKSLTFTAGATGQLGSASTALAFLAGGGLAWDVVEAASHMRHRIRARSKSIFFAAQLLDRAETSTRLRRPSLLRRILGRQ